MSVKLTLALRKNYEKLGDCNEQKIGRQSVMWKASQAVTLMQIPIGIIDCCCDCRL